MLYRRTKSFRFRFLFIGLMACLAACVGTPPARLPIDTHLSGDGQGSRVSFVVLHYTALDLRRSIQALTQGEVSAHYLITDETQPRVLRLVHEDWRAWHAGVSYWRGSRMLNASSIGIEIVNRGWTDGPQGRVFASYSEAQIETLIPLLQDIVKRHQISPQNVVGHFEIQPQHKQDPGPIFPWKRLADLGLIRWPDNVQVAQRRVAYEAVLPSVAWFQQALAALGFDVTVNGQLDVETRNVIAAFQMKYRPARYDGQPDAETAAMLAVLNSAP